MATLHQHLLVAIDPRSEGVSLRLRSDRPLELVVGSRAEAQRTIMEWLGREHVAGAAIEVRRGSSIVGTTVSLEVAGQLVARALRGTRPRTDP